MAGHALSGTKSKKLFKKKNLKKKVHLQDQTVGSVRMVLSPDPPGKGMVS
jgi:hypothetical protein